MTAVDFCGAGTMLFGSRGTVRDSAALLPDPKYYEGFAYVARYGISLNNRQLLAVRCFCRNCRHALDSNNHRIGGPRVFLDCKSEGDQGGSGAHFGGVTGDLYDNVEQDGVNFLGASSRGAEFRCFQAMFWNCRAKGMVCTQPPLATPPAGYNWAVGCSALPATSEEIEFIRQAARPRGAPDAAEGTQQLGPGTWDSFGKPVVPRSLYEQQLQERLRSAAPGA